MELFSIPCSTCGARLKVRSLAALGQIFNCPKCQSMVLVEAPPGWKPPPKPSPASPPAGAVRKGGPASKPRQAAATAAIPEALEMPMATLAEAGDSAPVIPLDAPWQSPSEARWRQGLWIGGAALAAVLVVAAAWTWWPDSTSAEALVADESAAGQEPVEPPPAPVNESIAEAAVAPAVVKDAPQVAPIPALPRRWLPADTRLVLSLPLSSLATHEVAPEILASGSSPLRQTLSDLRTTFHLLPEQIRQLTWAATEKSSDLRDSVVVIELSQPLEDDAALLAGCKRIDLQLADAVCHEPVPGGWPHPFAIVDPSTIVTGPREFLSALGRDEPLDQAIFAAALECTSAASCTLAVDLQHWTGWEQLKWPAPIEELLSAHEPWRLLRDTPQAVALTIDPASQALVEVYLLCETPQAAEQVRLALADVLADFREGSHVSLDRNTVVCRVSWPDDSRQLAASLLSSLPTWQAPPPLAAIIVTPNPPPPAQVPVIDSRETPFEREVSRRFDERIPAIALRGMKLVDFATFVSRLSGVTISVDEAALASAGMNVPPTIEVQLTAATIGEVLTAALSAHDLDYVARDNRLLITTRAKAKAARAK